MTTTRTTIITGICGFLIGVGSMAAWGDMNDEIPHTDIAFMSHGSMTMQEEMNGMVQSLSGATGDAFDKLFITEMIVHHQGAIDMAQMALISAGHDEIKDLARNIIAAQQTEVAVMQDWLEQWYGK